MGSQYQHDLHLRRRHPNGSSLPENRALSRTVFNDEALKVVAFGFAAGQELFPHTSPMAAVLHFVKGDAELTLGTEKMSAHAGSLVHMPPGLSHGITAKTPVVMLLFMLKQIRVEKS